MRHSECFERSNDRYDNCCSAELTPRFLRRMKEILVDGTFNFVNNSGQIESYVPLMCFYFLLVCSDNHLVRTGS